MKDASKTEKDFADRLLDLVNERKSKGDNVNAISQASGVASGAISEYINTYKQAGINNLVGLAKYFDVSTDFLLGLSTVREFKAETKAVEKRLGLTENAQHSAEQYKHLMPLLSFLLCNRDFISILKLLDKYARAEKDIPTAFESFVSHFVGGSDAEGIDEGLAVLAVRDKCLFEISQKIKPLAVKWLNERWRE